MQGVDVRCPICGCTNKSLFLDETDGWMECENCHNIVQILSHSKHTMVSVIDENYNVLMPILRNK